ncbi:hypothetical protein M595_6149 [Lyngbya aestuarii BL J]|uniref:Uncharacterized protein n=1 Tax=Lyngbya aestuarii BL J TaxID=1348334 RepID=U7Q7X5_9CYAN|nr:hypothetical protein M595_6149 [Lyngbya aestuarii BL J]
MPGLMVSPPPCAGTSALRGVAIPLGVKGFRGWWGEDFFEMKNSFL